MRHQKAGRKLNRNSSHRVALFRNLAKSLLLSENGRIVTTIPKAKELAGYMDSLITTAKKAPTLTVPEGVRFTKPKDKNGQVRPLKEGERMATPEELAAYAQRNHLRRLVLRDLHDPKLVKKLFEEIAPRYADRPGGYTRVLKLAERRRGDGTQLAVVELVK
ncbi:bL17 family ribosomal protein [Meiothermus ruber]|jgi:large subunit ribosomal protein L17|uniref:Large ribosomal subunit protein bL17 n=1 Tax=Meiothermus ruber (strain ATCC 35948 / DSM 1279 / VKM B-1258 / 21) TaxID=504728 RepID=D3PN13_MEIRD|nr:L17 family ribosomal protein [Meiothermus ruber]ADD29340.1 ribosomal protein L17 [Meiothermus ruber DSM 1279]AGK05210.1 50S ribosomal protein L17 [Meiothermus ruber DSM 1279]MCX7801527.1 50S ribosomal protein L17 [Meiothermus ruber]